MVAGISAILIIFWLLSHSIIFILVLHFHYNYYLNCMFLTHGYGSEMSIWLVNRDSCKDCTIWSFEYGEFFPQGRCGKKSPRGKFGAEDGILPSTTWRLCLQTLYSNNIYVYIDVHYISYLIIFSHNMRINLFICDIYYCHKNSQMKDSK
jgi:hypothetical protein